MTASQSTINEAAISVGQQVYFGRPTASYLCIRAQKRFDALLYLVEDCAMRRLLHRDLMRGHNAQRAAIILLMGLLLVLVAAFFHGVRLLRA